MQHWPFPCAIVIVAVSCAVFQHAASAQDNPAPITRQELIDWCNAVERFGSCSRLVPKIEETDRREPLSSAELEQIELNVVRDIAERGYIIEDHRKLLDFAHARNDFNPQLEEAVRATRSDDKAARYRGLLHLEYLSRSDLLPQARQAAADVMFELHNEYSLYVLATNVLAIQRERGGPDIAPVFFEAMRRNPAYAQHFAKVLSSFAPRDQIVRFGMDPTLPLEARRGIVRGGAMPHWSGELIAEGLEPLLWNIAQSEPDYELRQVASVALRQYGKSRPWRAIREDTQLHRDLRATALIGLLCVPPLLMLVGLFVARRWLLALWIVLSLWLIVLYGFMFLVGLAHGKPRDFEDIFKAIAITAGVQGLLLFLAFWLRRARLHELRYYEPPTATAAHASTKR
jgi:hypothetical protein